MNDPPHQGLLLCQDLMFVSKITNAADRLGLRIEATGNIAEGLRRVAGGGYHCVIVDLSLRPLAISDITSILPGAPPPPVIAFGAHVDTARLEEARLAGCREVFPRSQFHAKLDEILRRNFGAEA